MPRTPPKRAPSSQSGDSKKGGGVGPDPLPGLPGTGTGPGRGPERGLYFPGRSGKTNDHSGPNRFCSTVQLWQRQREPGPDNRHQTDGIAPGREVGAHCGGHHRHRLDPGFLVPVLKGTKSGVYPASAPWWTRANGGNCPWPSTTWGLSFLRGLLSGMVWISTNSIGSFRLFIVYSFYLDYFCIYRQFRGIPPRHVSIGDPVFFERNLDFCSEALRK